MLGPIVVPFCNPSYPKHTIYLFRGSGYILQEFVVISDLPFREVVDKFQHNGKYQLDHHQQVTESCFPFPNDCPLIRA